jgi:hypothetical protein
VSERLRRPDLDRPDGWDLIGERHVGPFLTQAFYRRPDGKVFEWTSRRQRKGLGLLPAGARPTPRRWWGLRFRSRNWWIGVLFMVGSACFIVGPIPGYGDLVGARADAITFFVGSIFFTSAAYLQFLQAINAPHTIDDVYLKPPGWQHVFTVEPHRIDWWSGSVQFTGTLFFNVTTFTGISDALELRGERALVWFPDWVGSVCFLIASYLAILEVCGGPWCRPKGTDWWIVMINMLGSIFFMASAVASFVLPDGEVRSEWVVGAGTVLGAVCFFVGAYLLVPEASETEAPTDAAAPGAGADD